MIGLRSGRVAPATAQETDWVPIQTQADGGAPASRSDHAAPATEHVLRSALVRFLLSSLLAFGVVAGVTSYWSLHIAEGEALRRAQATGIGVANRVMKPYLTPELLAGDRAAMKELDRAARNRMADGSIYRIKIWTQDERVLYSDEAHLIGRPFELAPADRALFGTNRASAEMSELTRDENVFEADKGKLVEVYAGFTATDGTPLVFEAYLPYETVKSAGDVLMRQLLPLSLGSLLLLLLLLLPLAVSLARRAERAQRERNRMLSTSIAASDVERRRIARDLHDGVVQDLAGLGYALTAIADGLPPTPESEPARQGARKAIRILRRDVDALRTLITDIYPPELDEGQLIPALANMLRTVGTDGPRMSLNAPDHLDGSLGRDSSVLLYGVVREAVRNAVKHAHASTVQVRLATEASRVTVEIVDDGVGMSGDAPPGHFGLRLLADTVRDAGGDFSIESRPGAGVRVRASLPIS
jgi:two-component system NarL family sensor kinase